jgi:hypothetical protein
MSSPDALPALQSAALQLYQLYDISYSIDLDRARETLAAPSTRVRPVVSRGASIDVPALPLEISMGERPVTLGEVELRAQVFARIYDLGIVALRLVLALPERLPWERATMLMAAAQSYPDPVLALFEASLDALRKMLAPAIERPNATVRTEDYAILVIARMGPGVPAAQLARHPALLQVALGERRPLSAAASALATPLSYYEDDLILLTWSAAVVIEPDTSAREDAAFLLEFANVQLLAFRSYDDEVARDLRLIMPRIAARRGRPALVLMRSSAAFLRDIHTLIADSTETSARMENALKVTEDVYWNRVYSAAINVLRVNVWRSGIAETLAVLRETAGLLHDEAQAAWASLLEVLVIALIAIELVVALLGLR